MSKILTTLLFLLFFNVAYAKETKSYIEDLEAVEANLLRDISGSRLELSKLSKYKNQFSEEEKYFYDVLDAHLLLFSGDLSKSEKILEKLTNQKSSKGLEAMRYVLIASIHHQRGESVKAFLATDKSLDLLNTIERPFYKAKVLTNAVSLYKDADLLEFALEHGRRAVHLANKTKSSFVICAASYELGAIELLAKKYMMAENRLNNARHHCEKEDSTLFLHAVDYSMLELKLETGKLKEAREIAEVLYPKVKDFGWSVLTSATQTLFARLLFKEGSYEKAEKLALESYKLANKINDKKRLSASSGLLAEIYSALKNNDEAVRYYQEYMELNVQNKTRIRQRKLAFDIARRGELH